MNSSIYRILHVQKPVFNTFQVFITKANYAKKEGGSVSMLGGTLKKKKLGKLGPGLEKKVLPVETNPEKLVSYVCGANIYRTGDDPKIKPDDQYPEWLWKLNSGPRPPLEELDPNSKEYWRIIRRMAMRRNNTLAQLKRF